MAATHTHLIPLEEVLRVQRYNPHAIEDRVRELERELRDRGVKLQYDWASRPCLTEPEATKLLAELLKPAEVREEAQGQIGVPTLVRRFWPGSGNQTAETG